jgi:hypothetical protein
MTKRWRKGWFMRPLLPPDDQGRKVRFATSGLDRRELAERLVGSRLGSTLTQEELASKTLGEEHARESMGTERH